MTITINNLSGEVIGGGRTDTEAIRAFVRDTTEYFSNIKLIPNPSNRNSFTAIRRPSCVIHISLTEGYTEARGIVKDWYLIFPKRAPNEIYAAVNSAIGPWRDYIGKNTYIYSNKTLKSVYDDVHVSNIKTIGDLLLDNTVGVAEQLGIRACLLPYMSKYGTNISYMKSGYHRINVPNSGTMLDTIKGTEKVEHNQSIMYYTTPSNIVDMAISILDLKDTVDPNKATIKYTYTYVAYRMGVGFVETDTSEELEIEHSTHFTKHLMNNTDRSVMRVSIATVILP